MSQSKYLPDLPSALAYCKAVLDSHNIRWDGGDFGNEEETTRMYWSVPSLTTIAIIDEVVICPSDLVEVGQDPTGFNFTDGYCNGYYFTDFYRQQK